MKRILITGVSGFVGTNLVSYLRGKPEYELFGHSRLNEVSNVKLVAKTDASTIDENKIETVIHLAGIAHDLGGKFKAEDYYRVNFEGTKNVVDEFLKSNATKFIFVSSIKATVDTSSVPAEEMMQPSPVTDYGKSKRMAEEYILSKSWGEKKFYILRPAMIHGPGNKGNLNLLYKFVRSGLPFPFGAFHNQRSFHSIENFSYAIESLLNKNIDSGIYHLADDGFLSTTELYRIIAEGLNKKSRVWNLPKGIIELAATITGKKSMVNKLTEDMMVSNEKIKKEIGAMPLSMKEGLIKTIRSFDEN
ncbi:MAG: NAD-dependent epimerase/dehydratase family protein [Cyclobacteriaceae bacterium]